MYQNRVTLIGFLGQDAEVRTTRSKRQFTVLSLATNRRWKDRASGEYQSRTTWHRCIAWGRMADFAATLTKGMHLQIEGEVRTREYSQAFGSGERSIDVTRSIAEVTVLSILKLDRAGKEAVESQPKGVTA